MDKKRMKIVYILGLSLIFTAYYYMSIVGVQGVMGSPENVVKASLINTGSNNAITFNVNRRLESISEIAKDEFQLLSAFLNDFILKAQLTYYPSINECDFSLDFISISNGKSMVTIDGFSEDNRIFFREKNLLNKVFYIDREQLPINDFNLKELLTESDSEIIRKGLLAYTTSDGNNSYANVYEIKEVLDGRENVISLMINNRLEIVHVDIAAKQNQENWINFGGDILVSDQEINAFDVSEAVLFEEKYLTELISE